ncbi:MAG: caspase family protein, partial [Candidatus Electrothrix sp. AW3_4]|nr:caspase family protein [Candidatus Electrothrix gigas]
MFFRFWNYLILLFLFQAAIPMRSYAQSIDFGRYHALLIANKNYTYWKRLKTPYNDVEELEKTLKNKYGFKVEILLDAKRDEIIDKLEELRRTLGGQDNLLIYYAGHGIMREDGGYWIGIDAKKKSRSKWLHVKTISGLISRNNKMKARHVLIIADSCYAGTMTRGTKNDRTAKKGSEKEGQFWFKRMRDKYSRTALTSGGNEPVIDHVGNSRHSIFADELIRCLKENNEALDTTSLYNQIKREVHARASRIADYAQAPEYADIPGTGDSRGDFIFVPKGTTIKFPPMYYNRHSKRPTKTPYFLDSSIYRGSSPTSITINFPDGNLVARYV